LSRFRTENPWGRLRNSVGILPGVLSGADEGKAVELLGRKHPRWPKQYLPAKFWVPHGQTFRKVFRLLKPEVLQERPASKVTRAPPRSARPRGIENNLPWPLDITLDEDRCRTRNDISALNLAIVRLMVFNILKREEPKLSLARKR
jgi:hypothetical protein